MKLFLLMILLYQGFIFAQNNFPVELSLKIDETKEICEFEIIDKTDSNQDKDSLNLNYGRFYVKLIRNVVDSVNHYYPVEGLVV